MIFIFVIYWQIMNAHKRNWHVPSFVLFIVLLSVLGVAELLFELQVGIVLVSNQMSIARGIQ